MHRQQCHPRKAAPSFDLKADPSPELATYYRIVETRNVVPVPVDSTSKPSQRRRTQDYDNPTGPGIAPLTFATATLIQNNLGGYGPDDGAEEMRFSGIGETVAGASVDLVVTVNSSVYEPNNAESNMINGFFGQVNQKAGVASDVSFCFEDTTSGENVFLDGFGFEFHDFDDATNSDESIVYANEVVTVNRMSSWEVSDDFDPPVPTQLLIENRKGGSKEFRSSQRGVGGDNAQDPDDLTDLQKSRMFRISYENIDCVFMRFVVEIQTDNGADNDCMPPWGGSRPLTSRLAHTPPLTRSRPMPQQMGATSFFR